MSIFFSITPTSLWVYLTYFVYLAYLFHVVDRNK